jgi:hypothetical protein
LTEKDILINTNASPAVFHKNKMPIQRLFYKVARLYECILNTTAYFLKFGMDTMKYLFFFLLSFSS